MAKNTLTVSRRDPRTRKSVTLASFTLERDGKVKEDYKDFRFRGDMRRGVRMGAKRYKPEDGASFMGALEKAYRTSSLFDVVRS